MIESRKEICDKFKPRTKFALSFGAHTYTHTHTQKISHIVPFRVIIPIPPYPLQFANIVSDKVKCKVKFLKLYQFEPLDCSRLYFAL